MRLLFCLPLLCALGCGLGTGVGVEPEYTGCATDELWPVFDDAEVSFIADLSQSPSVLTPQAGAQAQKPIFTWNQSPSSQGRAGGDISPDDPTCKEQYNIGALTTLHLPAISGTVYDVQLTSGGAPLWRVLTTLQEWTPTDDQWTKWQGKTVQLRIFRMTVKDNVRQDGPFSSGTNFSFTVGG